MTFAWRPGSQYNVAVTRGADSVLASDCRAQFGRPSTRRGCRICVTVRLPVRPRGETMYWQANANTPLSVTPLLNVPYIFYTEQMDAEGLGRKLLLTASGEPRKAPADRGYCDSISQNANPASTFELSQCRHRKEGLPGPRRGFLVPSGSLSPKPAASICGL